MSTKNTLLIHIGTNKTGTTAIQKFLYNNNEALMKFNWCYPNLRKDFPDYESLDMDDQKNGNIFLNKDYSYDTCSARWKNVWKNIRHYLENYNVIISAEEMYNPRMGALFESIIKEYDNIKVIVYLRRQDYYLESEWKQAIKSEYCEVRSVYERKKNSELYDYLTQIKSLEAVVGKENIIVRVFENGQYEGEWNTITSDFLKSIGIEKLTDFRDVGKENEGIDANSLEIKRLINRYLCDCGELKNKINYYYVYHLKKTIPTTGKAIGYLTKDERKEILSMYEEGNRIIARDYLERTDGVLFYDGNIDIPQYNVESSLLLEDAIKFFGKVLVEQQKIIENLSGSGSISEKAMTSKIKSICKGTGKKIILFGAGERCRYLLDNSSIQVEYIIDNNEAIIGKNINGIEIVSPAFIKNWNKYIVIITCRDNETIQEQLNSYSLKNGQDYILMSHYFI
ncbi:MAG: hypothetical protein IJV71_03660 [Lachnospiraceae bacterium]|nr:hypothetical protein [Lachnospiraceae bacterium]